MRAYATLLPAFWTGTTGKAITAARKDARIVATYVLTCEHANMLGLYRLPLLYVAEETGLKRREVSCALKQLKAIGFVDYDETSEFVWVVEMARFQLGLLPNETLKEGDNRAKGAARLYKQIPANPFLGPFHDRYSQILRLPIRRDFTSKTEPLQSPLGGALKYPPRDYVPDPGPVPDLVQKGNPGETKAVLEPLAELTPEYLRERWNALPSVKPCKALDDSIRTRLLTRLKEHPDPAWWDRLFQQVRASDFLCGRMNGTRGAFQATLDWVLGQNNIGKVLRGNYDTIHSASKERIPL
jgi:hypothetical protein